jgi:hypothetical protein
MALLVLRRIVAVACNAAAMGLFSFFAVNARLARLWPSHMDGRSRPLRAFL